MKAILANTMTEEDRHPRLSWRTAMLAVLGRALRLVRLEARPPRQAGSLSYPASRPPHSIFHIRVHSRNLQFKFFALAPRAVLSAEASAKADGDKWAGHGWPALPVCCVLCGFAVTSSVFGATTWSQTWNISTAIPDNDDVGFSDTRTVSIPDITEIESVTVGLNFTGGWNGDLYAYLVHGSGFAVLLNRPGRSTGAPDGSATVGLDITLDDSAFADIHTGIPLSGGTVTGAYQPNGRIADPLAVLDTDPRPALLASFTGLDASGNWTLFVADQSAGETSTLQSWTLTITGVPEPSAALLGSLGVLLLLRRRRGAHAPSRVVFSAPAEDGCLP